MWWWCGRRVATRRSARRSPACTSRSTSSRWRGSPTFPAGGASPGGARRHARRRPTAPRRRWRRAWRRSRAPTARTRARRRRVLLQVWNRPIYTVGGKHLMSDALRVCGARNVFADLPEPGPVVDTEAVIARDPGHHHRRGAAGGGRRVGRRLEAPRQPFGRAQRPRRGLRGPGAEPPRAERHRCDRGAVPDCSPRVSRGSY